MLMCVFVSDMQRGSNGIRMYVCSESVWMCSVCAGG